MNETNIPTTPTHLVDALRAYVCVNSWAGRQEHPCRVVGETPKRYRIEVDKPTALPPGFALLLPGQTRLVPKTAIRFDAALRGEGE